MRENHAWRKIDDPLMDDAVPKIIQNVESVELSAQDYVADAGGLHILHDGHGADGVFLTDAVPEHFLNDLNQGKFTCCFLSSELAPTKYLAFSESMLLLRFMSSDVSLSVLSVYWLQIICSSTSAQISGTFNLKLSMSPLKM